MRESTEMRNEHRVDTKQHRTDANAVRVEIASLLLMHQEILLETVNDLTLITKVVMS